MAAVAVVASRSRLRFVLRLVHGRPIVACRSRNQSRFGFECFESLFLSHVARRRFLNPSVRAQRHTRFMTFNRTATGYCQNCIREVDHKDLRRVLLHGRPYWLCVPCLEPVPDEREKYKRPT